MEGIVELLVVGGAMVLVLLLGAWCSPLAGEAFEWQQYLLLGSAFPVLVLALSVPGRAPLWARSRTWARRALVLILFVAVSVWVRRAAGALVLASAAVQTALLVWLQRRVRPLEVVALAWISLVAWIGASRLVYWRPFAELSLASAYKAALFASLFALTFAGLFRLAPDRSSRGSRTLTRVIDATALLVFAAASLQTPAASLARSAFHHWGFFVGPASGVRQGGFLLWDLPSQYGFLSILCAAAFPARTTWESVYFQNAILLFACAAFLYWLLRRSLDGVLGAATALLAVGCGTFMVPGWLPALSGVTSWPSVGAFRFVWCYALVGILYWTWVRERARRSTTGMRWLGSCVWVCAVLWSSESGVYGSILWLPAFLLLLLGDRGRRSPSRIVLWTGLPPLLLGLTAGSIALFYRARVGHLPDVASFFEYSRAHAAGGGALPVNRQGAVWELLLAFAAAATVLLRRAGSLVRPGFPADARLALELGTLGMLWAVSSYFVPRSHDNNVLNLVPLVLLVFAVVLAVLREETGSGLALAVKAALFPMLPVLLTVSFCDRDRLADYVSRLGRLDIHRALVPRSPGSLQEALVAAGVGPSDPIAIVHIDLLPAVNLAGSQIELARSWLPGVPFSLYRHLSEERRRTYMTRFADRRRIGGWLVVPKGRILPGLEWILPAVEERYRMIDRFENDEWEIRRYEPR